LQNQLEKSKREKEAANIDLDHLKVEIEKERTLSKAKYRDELDEVLRENETLRGEIERSRDREKLHEVRRDHEESKLMQEELQKQVADLRKQRDEVSEEKIDLQISLNREVEDERSRRRVAVQEADTFKFKVKCLEDDLQKAELKNSCILKELEVLESEKFNTQTMLNEKTLLIDSLNREVKDREEMVRDLERDSEIESKRVTESQRGQEFSDR